MKTINVYLFSELNEKAQAIALNNFEGDCLWNHRDSIDQMKEDLTAIGLGDIDIRYSGFWSQGDGLSFTAQVDDMPLFCKHIGVPCIQDVEVSFYRTTSHHCHENTCTTIIEAGIPESHEHEKQLHELEQAIEIWRLKECQRLYSQLERDYECSTGSDAVAEYFEANEFYFLEDGQRVRAKGL